MMVLLLSASVFAAQQEPIRVSLEEAVERVIAVSPTIAAARGAVAAPLGARAEEFGPFPSNPTFEYGRTRRRSPQTTVFDREWSVNQEVEIAGQWLQRRQAANLLVRSVEEAAADSRRQVSHQARLAFLDLNIAERRTALTDSAAAFTERLADFARRQLEAGEISRLERNAAILEAARARSAAQRSLAERAALEADLARLMDLSSDQEVVTASLPGIPDLRVSDQSRLIILARNRRADLSAARFASAAADRSFAASKLWFVPNLNVSLFGGREDATDNLFGVAIGLSIPLFKRGQASRGFAAAERTLAEAALMATERAIQSDVRSAIGRYERTRQAERRFATGVLGAASENVDLTEIALIEGEVSLTDVMVLRTAAVAAQLEYLEVLSDATEAWFQLAAALNAEPADLTRLINNEGNYREE